MAYIYYELIIGRKTSKFKVIGCWSTRQ